MRIRRTDTNGAAAALGLSLVMMSLTSPAQAQQAASPPPQGGSGPVSAGSPASTTPFMGIPAQQPNPLPPGFSPQAQRQAQPSPAVQQGQVTQGSQARLVTPPAVINPASQVNNQPRIDHQAPLTPAGNAQAASAPAVSLPPSQAPTTPPSPLQASSPEAADFIKRSEENIRRRLEYQQQIELLELEQRVKTLQRQVTGENENGRPRNEQLALRTDPTVLRVRGIGSKMVASFLLENGGIAEGSVNDVVGGYRILQISVDGVVATVGDGATQVRKRLTFLGGGAGPGSMQAGLNGVVSPLNQLNPYGVPGSPYAGLGYQVQGGGISPSGIAPSGGFNQNPAGGAPAGATSGSIGAALSAGMGALMSQQPR